jgi:hypothetical protein
MKTMLDFIHTTRRVAQNVSEIEFIEKKDLMENFINQAPLCCV